MLILGIESSCDDTSVALLDCSEQGCFVIKETTAGQIDIHKKYGGVVPELAGRAHAEKIVPLIEELLSDQNKPDAIAVTAGPGLITGLLVGVETAKVLSYAWRIPLVAVNHLEGHIHSVEIDKQEINYPALALIASGGHTELVFIPKRGQYRQLGSTKDDAAGECFDKVAKLLGLPYPGGPEIARLAAQGDPQSISLPRPMLDQDNYDFSFSGLKTAALYWLRDHTGRTLNFKLSTLDLQNFCASLQQAIVDVLVAKTSRAAGQYRPTTLILAGGVSANTKLRQELQKMLAKNITFLAPSIPYAMDNAAMIAAAGYQQARRKHFCPWKKLTANPGWKIYE